MEKSKIAKPLKHVSEHYNWSEIEKYIGKKYGKELRDWAGRFDTRKDWNKRYGKKKGDPEKIPYQDFWHWLLDHNEISNGTLTRFYPGPWQGDYENEPEWVQEIFKILEKEFGSEFEVHIYW